MGKVNYSTAIKEFKGDLADAMKQKVNIDGKIVSWLELFDKKKEDSLEKAKRSSFVYRLVRKQVKTQTAVICDAFSKTRTLFDVTITNSKKMKDAERMSQMLNYFWKSKTPNRRVFINDVYSTSAKEGTVIGKVGMVGGVPRCELIKNENFFIDPTATSFDSAQFMIHKMRKTISDLKKDEISGLYSNIDNVVDEYRQEVRETNTLESYRSNINNIDTTKEFTGSRMKVDVYEYWGYYDFNQNGISVPIVCTFCGDTIIRFEESPFGELLPFVYATYDRNSNNFWGDALPEVIENNQKIVSALTRSIIENSAYNNLGIKAVKKGSLDNTNRRILEAGVPGSVVEINTSDSISSVMTPLPVEPLNPQIFSMIELFKQDAEEQTGVSRNMTGSIQQYTTAFAENIGASFGEKRLFEFVDRSIETFWIRLSRIYIHIIINYIPQEVVHEITGDTDFIQWSITENEADIEVNISGLDTIKVQGMINLLQYVTMATKDTDINAEVITHIVGKICEIQGFSDIADLIRDSKPVPNESEMAKTRAEIELANAETQVKIAQAQKTLAEIDIDKIKAMNAVNNVEIKKAVTASRIEEKRAQTLINATVATREK